MTAQPQVLTLTFGTYPLGLVPSLLILGPLSGRIGRRTVLLPALLPSLPASAIFLGGATGWPDSSSPATVLGVGVLLSLTPSLPILRATAGGRPSD